ncbi:Immunoglobulin I-set [Trinorchestia longiramus]|nr:Immunoglobulin I-set [Trinorchestia longiramus]
MYNRNDNSFFQAFWPDLMMFVLVCTGFSGVLVSTSAQNVVAASRLPSRPFTPQTDFLYVDHQLNRKIVPVATLTFVTQFPDVPRPAVRNTSHTFQYSIEKPENFKFIRPDSEISFMNIQQKKNSKEEILKQGLLSPTHLLAAHKFGIPAIDRTDITSVKIREYLKTNPHTYRRSDGSGSKSFFHFDDHKVKDSSETGHDRLIFNSHFIRKRDASPKATADRKSKHSRDGKKVIDGKDRSTVGLIEASGVNEESWNDYIDKLFDPDFDTSIQTNISAVEGQTVHMGCRVNNLGTKTVSWIRHADTHILTVGSSTYTSDHRFSTLHRQGTNEWTLQLRDPTLQDAGLYECQVSTKPVRAHVVHLSVVVPSASIISAPELYIDEGSALNLTCVVSPSPRPPEYIFWYHRGEVINYETDRRVTVTVQQTGLDTVCSLVVLKATLDHSGRYQCAPSNAQPADIVVHIFKAEEPAAMQTSTGSTPTQGATCSVLLAIFNIVILFTFCKQPPSSPELNHAKSRNKKCRVRCRRRSSYLINSILVKIGLTGKPSPIDVSSTKPSAY